MTTTTMMIRARFDGTAFVPLDRVDLVAGALVDLEVRAGTTADRDSPVDRETFDEFERILAEADVERKAAAVREMSEPGIFDDMA